MRTFLTILKWFFGIIFLTVGLGGLFTSFLTGISFIILGLFILPPTFELFTKKSKVNLPTWVKWRTAIVGCIIASLTMDNSNAKKDVEMDLVVVKAFEFINNGQIDSAKVYIEKVKSQYSTIKNKEVDLQKELYRYKLQDFAKENLVSMSNQQLKKQKEFNRNRKRNIEKQFSSWDGSHPTLSRMIKECCKNPDSYEHIQTRFRDDGKSIFVITKYRAENGFGGMTTENVSVRVDFDGNVIDIVSQE